MPEINRAVPAYEQIAEHYLAAIKSGQHAPRDEPPSSRALRDEWRVTLKVAHRALALLRDDGWIVSPTGKPSVVAERPPDHRPTHNESTGSTILNQPRRNVQGSRDSL